MSKTEQEILRRRLKERRLFLNMTYQDLADKTGISKSTLQRYETGGIKNLPYDKIFTLSEALEVNPEYFTDLSKDYTAVGSTEPKRLKDRDNRAQIYKQLREFEKKALEHITPGLVSKEYKVEHAGRGSVGDLVAKKGKEVWHIDFLYINWESKDYRVKTGNGTHQLFMRFGRLAVYNKPITKYSIVVASHEIADYLIDVKPLHLDIEISIIVLTEDGYEELDYV